MKTLFLLLFITIFSYFSTVGQKTAIQISVVAKPENNSTNLHYLNNRAPLVQAYFLKLPVGAITPHGWLGEYLNRQRDGLTGNLMNISAWLQKADNAWLSKDGKGKYGWEEVPYWLKGYGNIGYILKDPGMIAEARFWIEGVIRSQRADGDFGAAMLDRNGAEDFWPKMIMLFCMQSYYEYSKDKRILSFMKNYFKYQLEYPEEKFLQRFHYWQGLRTGDNLHSVIWLYNISGDTSLLRLAEKIHRNSTSWANRNSSFKNGNHDKSLQPWPDWFSILPDWHNVNVAQGFREPAIFYQVSGKKEDLQASYDVHSIVRKYFGQVPGGMFGSDEVARPGYTDPHQGIETCGMVEEMNSDQEMMRISGDPVWADQAENVAFNTYPAAVMPDFKSLRYITSPNMVLNDDKNHHPGIDNSGPFLMMNPFSSRCCQHNHSQGWPYYAENLWMATPDNGVASTLYAASSLQVKVGKGQEVFIEEETNYPFEESVRFRIKTTQSVQFPLYLRIPSWCANASLKINGKQKSVRGISSKFLRIETNWKNGDLIELQLPMKLKLIRWKENKSSVSVNYGPLTFSLKIGEEYVRKSSTETAIGDSKWQSGADAANWPSFEIHPTTSWNYGLLLSDKKFSDQFEIIRKPWPKDNFPFTLESVPLELRAKGKKIPEWKIDENGLCGQLMQRPVKTAEPAENLVLVPMGAARLRISAFPVVQ